MAKSIRPGHLGGIIGGGAIVERDIGTALNLARALLRHPPHTVVLPAHTELVHRLVLHTDCFAVPPISLISSRYISVLGMRVLSANFPSITQSKALASRLLFGPIKFKF